MVPAPRTENTEVRKVGLSTEQNLVRCTLRAQSTGRHPVTYVYGHGKRLGPEVLWQIFVVQHGSDKLDERAVHSLCHAILMGVSGGSETVGDPSLFKEELHFGRDVLPPVIRLQDSEFGRTVALSAFPHQLVEAFS